MTLQARQELAKPMRSHSLPLTHIVLDYLLDQGQPGIWVNLETLEEYLEERLKFDPAYSDLIKENVPPEPKFRFALRKAVDELVAKYCIKEHTCYASWERGGKQFVGYTSFIEVPIDGKELYD